MLHASLIAGVLCMVTFLFWFFAYDKYHDDVQDPDTDRRYIPRWVWWFLLIPLSLGAFSAVAFFSTF